MRRSRCAGSGQGEKAEDGGAHAAWSGGGNGGGLWGALNTGTIPLAPMTPSMWMARMGLGNAAAEGGRETWTAASTRTTTLLATFGNSRRVDRILERVVCVFLGGRLDINILRWRFFRLRGVEREENKPGWRQLVALLRMRAW